MYQSIKNFYCIISIGAQCFNITTENTNKTAQKGENKYLKLNVSNRVNKILTSQCFLFSKQPFFFF